MKILVGTTSALNEIIVKISICFPKKKILKCFHCILYASVLFLNLDCQLFLSNTNKNCNL